MNEELHKQIFDLPFETFVYPVALFEWDKINNLLYSSSSDLLAFRQSQVAKRLKVDVHEINPAWISYWLSEQESFIIQGNVKRCNFSFTTKHVSITHPMRTFRGNTFVSADVDLVVLVG